jgi:tetratricopeptide (TPR) repeat protein
MTARSELTLGGRAAIEPVLERLNLPKSWWEEIRFCLTLLLLLGVIGFDLLLLPRIGVWYRHNGSENYKQGNLASAESDYKQALSLNPDDEITHFYLGLLYEDVGDFNQARTQYQMALPTEKGCDPIEICMVYINLARLYILDGKDGKYKQAISLLEQLESQLRESQLREKEKAELKYIRRKNLGWARLKLEQFASAKANLKFALDIAEQHPSKISQKKQASVHCLLAQVLDEQVNTNQVNKKWETCLGVTGSLPEEAYWKGMAQEQLSR